jgi:arylsulfatase A-like enzyme
VLAACAVLTACGRSEPDPPNIVLIVVDTLRADHVGCYGQSRNTSPNLDELAAQGYRFERAYSTAPWTMSSVASMFTGLYPSSHGVTRVSRLPNEALTLAEILQSRDYATAGVVSHVVLSRTYDFQQGFEQFEDRVPGPAHSDISTGRVTDKAIEYLDSLSAAGRPFFLFAHYFDPHYNYLPHPEVDFAPRRVGRLDATQTIKELRAMSADLTAREVAFIRDLYDEEIWHTDAGIGRLLDRLAELGLDDETWVIVTADHGEEFLTHGWLGHTRTLYEELLRVPLILRPPGGLPEPRLLPDPVSLVALSPTLVDLAGDDSSLFRFQASSLEPLLTGARDHSPGVAFAEVDFIPVYADNWVKRTHKKALITDRFKLIRDDPTGRLELYDLQDDPYELRDLAELRPELVDELLPALEEAVAYSRGRAMGEVEAPRSDERLEQLRSLGYVGN